jgi:Eco57I restriction-modification methylase/TaqI-like C-terminal specificity domain
MAHIEELADADIAQVRESVKTFEIVEEATAPLRAFLDCWHALLWLPPAADLIPPGGHRKERAAKIKQKEQERRQTINAWLDGGYGDPVELAGGAVPKGVPNTARQIAALLDELRAIARRQHLLHWQPAFPGVWAGWSGIDVRGGFDAVIGNPPWVRQESLHAMKNVLKERYRTYEGKADLCTFFLEQALRLVRPGGRVGFVLPNKFFKTDYGEPLREFLGANAWIEQVVDFGHNRDLFPEPDVFPCVLAARRPEPAEEAPTDATVAVIPGDRADQDRLSSIVADLRFPMPLRSFNRSGWVLEPPDVRALMERIGKQNGTLLALVGRNLYRGVLTGFNDAFVVDTSKRDQLVSEDPASAHLFKRFLRGQDIERWASDWCGHWMIFIRHGTDIDRFPAMRAHLSQFRKSLEPRPSDWKGNDWPGRKPGQYRWWEIQDSIAYFAFFEQPKIIYQEIQFYPAYNLDASGFYLNNKGFMIPASDSFLLAALNSPLLWWFGWRHFAHMKDEALTPQGFRMETLPIARPNQEQAERAEAITGKLAAIHRQRHQARHALADWLRVEWNLARPPTDLLAPFELSADGFAEVLRKALPKQRKLTIAEVAAIKDAPAETVAPIAAKLAEAERLERQLSAVVNAAYRLTPEEEALVWRTAPPRMPISPPGPTAAAAQ